jgi:hypothetical protein
LLPWVIPLFTILLPVESHASALPRREIVEVDPMLEEEFR